MQREETGKGQWIHTSLLQAQIAMLDFQAARWLVDGEVPTQAGNNHPTSTPTGVFMTADVEINVACAGETMWKRLCMTLEAKDLLENPKYATEKLRFDNRDSLHKALANYLMKRSGSEWIEILNAAGVPCGPIYSINEVFSDSGVQHLSMEAPVSHPVLGNLNLLKHPVNMSAATSMPYNATPERGEHTNLILAEHGYSSEEIEILRRDGII